MCSTSIPYVALRNHQAAPQAARYAAAEHLWLSLHGQQEIKLCHMQPGVLRLTLSGFRFFFTGWSSSKASSSSSAAELSSTACMPSWLICTLRSRGRYICLAGMLWGMPQEGLKNSPRSLAEDPSMASRQQLCQSQLQTLCKPMLTTDCSVTHCTHNQPNMGRSVNRYSD